jgi:hypothetical protein
VREVQGLRANHVSAQGRELREVSESVPCPRSAGA